MDSMILEIGTGGLHRYEPIRATRTTVGRALDNDIILSDPTVAPHHLQILCLEDGSVELVNLAEVNPTRVDGRRVDRHIPSRLPLAIDIGRVRVRLLSRDQPVAATRPLAGGGNRRHLFGHALSLVKMLLEVLQIQNF